MVLGRVAVGPLEALRLRSVQVRPGQSRGRRLVAQLEDLNPEVVTDPRRDLLGVAGRAVDGHGGLQEALFLQALDELGGDLVADKVLFEARVVTAGASPAREVSTGAIAIAAAIGGGLFVTFLGNICLAPYRQRNEALKLVKQSAGDDVSVARARLEQSELVDSNGQVVTGVQVFTTLADELITGMDNRFIPMALGDKFKDTGNWNILELGRLALNSFRLAEVVEVEHRPGAVPDKRGSYGSIAAGPHDIYRLSDLGRRVYIQLQDDMFK